MKVLFIEHCALNAATTEQFKTVNSLGQEGPFYLMSCAERGNDGTV